MYKKFATRFIITLIGVSFILLGIAWGMLGFLGEKTTGIITDVRREMGERTDSKPGRYTYSIGYSFELPGGKLIYGNAKRVSDGVYIKNQNMPVTVRYFEIFPHINALEGNTGFNLGNVIMILAGCVLVVVVNKY